MSIAENDLEFLKDNHGAAMITVSRDGTPKVARVGVALIDGKVWSSGTQDRTRTKRLRRDPRCTLYVHDSGFSWLALEGTVTILEGPDAPDLNLRLFREMQSKSTGPLTWFGRELPEKEFLEAIVDERRLIYELAVSRTYGLH